MIERGDVWWADISDPAGSGPGCRLPVVVMPANCSGLSSMKVIGH